MELVWSHASEWAPVVRGMVGKHAASVQLHHQTPKCSDVLCWPWLLLLSNRDTAHTSGVCKLLTEQAVMVMILVPICSSVTVEGSVLLYRMLCMHGLQQLKLLQC